MRRQTPLFCVDVYTHTFWISLQIEKPTLRTSFFLDFSKISEILHQLEGVDPIDDWVLGYVQALRSPVRELRRARASSESPQKPISDRVTIPLVAVIGACCT